MRDPNRLYNFYDELKRIHMTYVPDWRFGQMLENIFGTTDIFYREEGDILEKVKEYFGDVGRYYDVVASICNETCRTDSYLISGGFYTEEEAREYINLHDVSEVDYYRYCRDDETAYIEIEERDDNGNIINVVTIY